MTHVTHVTLGESLDVWAQEKTEEKKAEIKEEEKKLSFTKPRLCHDKSCSSRMREPLPPVQVENPRVGPETMVDVGDLHI